MLHITLKQLSLGTTTKGSEIAFQAANAGMECLRYLRNDQSDEMYAGDPVLVKCLGEPSVQFTDIPTTDANTNHYMYHNDAIDWVTTGGDSLCVDMEVHLLIADGDPIAYNFGGASSKTCASGDVCTFGFVRGYNRNCTDIGTNSIFTVQRELTVEF
jgi:hypothetical protein